MKHDDFVWYTFGIHPHHASDFTQHTYELLKVLLKLPKVVALGECGLDYSGNNSVDPTIQKFVFKCQLRMAMEMKLPVCLHIRDADEDGYAILEEVNFPTDHRIHLHCFNSSWEVCEKWISKYNNLRVGFTPVIKSMSAESRNVVKKLPLEKILLETDAPYFLADENSSELNFNHPGFVYQTAIAVAHLKNITVEQAIEANRKSVQLVYGVPNTEVGRGLPILESCAFMKSHEPDTILIGENDDDATNLDGQDDEYQEESNLLDHDTKTKLANIINPPPPPKNEKEIKTELLEDTKKVVKMEFYETSSNGNNIEEEPLATIQAEEAFPSLNESGYNSHIKVESSSSSLIVSSLNVTEENPVKLKEEVPSEGPTVVDLSMIKTETSSGSVPKDPWKELFNEISNDDIEENPAKEEIPSERPKLVEYDTSDSENQALSKSRNATPIRISSDFDLKPENKLRSSCEKYAAPKTEDSKSVPFPPLFKHLDSKKREEKPTNKIVEAVPDDNFKRMFDILEVAVVKQERIQVEAKSKESPEPSCSSKMLDEGRNDNKNDAIEGSIDMTKDEFETTPKDDTNPIEEKEEIVTMEREYQLYEKLNQVLVKNNQELRTENQKLKLERDELYEKVQNLKREINELRAGRNGKESNSFINTNSSIGEIQARVRESFKSLHRSKMNQKVN